MYQIELWNDDATILFLCRRVAEAQEYARMWEDIAEVQLSGPYLGESLMRVIEQGAEILC